MKKQLLALLFILPIFFSCTKTPSEIDGSKWKYTEHPTKDVQVNFYLSFSDAGTGSYDIYSITAPSKEEKLLVHYNIDKYSYESKKLSFTCSNKEGEYFTIHYRAEKDYLIYESYDPGYTLTGFQIVPQYSLMK